MAGNQNVAGNDAISSPVYNFGFVVLVVLCAAASYYFRDGTSASTKEAIIMESAEDLMDKDADDDKKDDDTQRTFSGSNSTGSFKVFQRNYLLVYCLVMMSDWLQGSYIYPLYKSYGYDLKIIGILFVVGFLSSAIFGTIVGSIADRLGRKRFSILFCIVYAASCLTKLSPSLSILMFGRLLGGIATSLLFSVFEAWMVSEHFSRGFKEPLLSDTFTWATFLNGLVAISSGVIANFCVSQWGVISPFMAAIFFLAAAGIIVHNSWSENYGTTEVSSTQQSSLSEAFQTIWRNATILSVGMMQCSFESAMYTFVFLWSPVLEAATYGDSLPYGIIFASFMVSIMIGSVAFRALLRSGWQHVEIARLAFALGSLSLFGCAILKDEILLFFLFNVFELSCGLYFPSIGTIRGRHVPEETRSTIMNVFRVPLNLIVVAALLKVDSVGGPTLFFICGCLVAVAFASASRLAKL